MIDPREKSAQDEKIIDLSQKISFTIIFFLIKWIFRLLVV